MTYEQLVSDMQAEFPSVRIVMKTSWFWKVLNFFVKVFTFWQNKTFLTQYVTTIANVIGVPTDWPRMTELTKVAILRHERVHLRQQRKCGLGSFWCGLVPFWTAYLLLPLPVGLAYCRYLFEREAYTESLRCKFEQDGYEAALAQIEFYALMLSSGAYGFTWPFPTSIKEYFVKRLNGMISVNDVSDSNPTSEQ